LERDFEVVAQANDGMQVLDILQQYKPGILLLDLKMPQLDGLATLKQLQAVQNETRVIVLTASDDKNEFVDATKLGASGIVRKQTATETLIKSIRTVHAGEMWLDSETAGAVVRQFVVPDKTPAPSVLQPPPSRDRNRWHLSPRELQIVALVAQGYKNKGLAEKLFISEQTVKNHLHNIFDKLRVGDRVELALFAVSHRLDTNK
jgi:two-component system, NarL family, nitrate/nitrite response regulator NarL